MSRFRAHPAWVPAAIVAGLAATMLVIAGCGGGGGSNDNGEALKSVGAGEGQLNLVGRSLDTSRRFDALKVLIALRTVGRRRLAEIVERCVELTAHAARAIEARSGLALVAEPQTVMVAFRVPGGDAANIRVQRSLFASGRAVLGRTRIHGEVALKLTLLNPLTTPADVDALLDLVVSEAAAPAP